MSWRAGKSLVATGGTTETPQTRCAVSGGVCVAHEERLGRSGGSLGALVVSGLRLNEPWSGERMVL